MTLAVLFIAIAVTVGFTGLCSFNPGKPENGPVQEVDAATFLTMESRRVDYPVRNPQVPQEWVANSARAGNAAGNLSTIVGYVTASGAYLQLLQTDAPVDKLPADSRPRREDGELEVSGVRFQRWVPEGDNRRSAWVGDYSEVRFVLEGTATEEEFKQLAEAAIAAEPVQ